MAVTLASLRLRYPEYDNAADALVTACITAAEAEYSEGTCSALYDEIVLEAACHRLSLTAYGREMAIDRASGVITKHQARLQELALAAGSVSAGIAWDD